MYFTSFYKSNTFVVFVVFVRQKRHLQKVDKEIRKGEGQSIVELIMF